MAGFFGTSSGAGGHVAQGDSQVQGVLVKILGEEYRIAGDPGQVQEVAAYVDARMKEIAGRHPGLRERQVAILAAMQIAAELLKLMADRKDFTDRAKDSLERLIDLVEDRGEIAGEEAGDEPAANPRLREQPVRLPTSRS